MKFITVVTTFLWSVLFVYAKPEPAVGFTLPDSLQELSLKFTTRGNLIVLPVLINKSIAVNLILDTGCRNLVLFGKEFLSKLNITENKPIAFSGLGNGEPVTGKLSLNNIVEIASIAGQSVPIVVVSEKNLFSRYRNVHGIIGYDLFLKFEIELNFLEKEMKFRPAQLAEPRENFKTVELTVVDSKPVMQSSITVKKNETAYNLMIDTGSELGLIIKTSSPRDMKVAASVIGFGLNGEITGYAHNGGKIKLASLELNDVYTSIIETNEGPASASLGMGTLKDYIVILNYCKAYVSFKPNTA